MQVNKTNLKETVLKSINYHKTYIGKTKHTSYIYGLFTATSLRHPLYGGQPNEKEWHGV